MTDVFEKIMEQIKKNYVVVEDIGYYGNMEETIGATVFTFTPKDEEWYERVLFRNVSLYITQKNNSKSVEIDIMVKKSDSDDYTKTFKIHENHVEEYFITWFERYMSDIDDEIEEFIEECREELEY